MSFSNHVVPPKHTTETGSDTIKEYERKTYAVKAVQVTDENMLTVAEWCGGSVKGIVTQGDSRMYVEVPVGKNAKTSQAEVKDWVIMIPKAGKNQRDAFAIYNEWAFGRAFAAKPELVVAKDNYDKKFWRGQQAGVSFTDEQVIEQDLQVAQSTKEQLAQSEGIHNAAIREEKLKEHGLSETAHSEVIGNVFELAEEPTQRRATVAELLEANTLLQDLENRANNNLLAAQKSRREVLEALQQQVHEELMGFN